MVDICALYSSVYTLRKLKCSSFGCRCLQTGSEEDCAVEEGVWGTEEVPQRDAAGRSQHRRHGYRSPFHHPPCKPDACDFQHTHSLSSLPPSLSPLSLLVKEKQKKQREFVVPGSSTIPHAVSFEDLRRHRDQHLSSSKRSVDSFGNIRRTKSDSDVALQSLKKKVEVCTAVCFDALCVGGLVECVYAFTVCVCVAVTCNRQY